MSSPQSAARYTDIVQTALRRFPYRVAFRQVDQSLTYAGLDLGFSSYSHFSTAFKQAYGLTPLAFQRSS